MCVIRFVCGLFYRKKINVEPVKWSNLPDSIIHKIMMIEYTRRVDENRQRKALRFNSMHALVPEVLTSPLKNMNQPNFFDQSNVSLMVTHTLFMNGYYQTITTLEVSYERENVLDDTMQWLDLHYHVENNEVYVHDRSTVIINENHIYKVSIAALMMLIHRMYPYVKANTITFKPILGPRKMLSDELKNVFPTPCLS